MANEKLEILRLLLENKDKEYSIRQVAQERKINYKSAYQNIKKLEKEGPITVKNKGNISLCSFNNVFSESVFLAENQRKSELLKDKNFLVIYDRIKSINQQFVLLLFGSRAKGMSTKHSDIDFLLVADSPHEIEEKLESIPLKIHLTTINCTEFIEMLKTKDANVVSEANKRNIVLFGMEDYYRMIGNAK